MQEFENGGLLKVSQEINILAEKQIEYKRIGCITLKPGHSLFSINMRTLEVKKVIAIKTVMIDYESKKPIKIQKTNLDPDLYYIGALNSKNAMRHYRKELIKYFRNLHNKNNHENARLSTN